MMSSIDISCVYFEAPYQVTSRSELLPLPKPDQLLVKTRLSAISPGTEMLIYRGLFPGGSAVDTTIPSLEGEFGYPMRYGYAAVGVVKAGGPKLDATWLDRRVFCFQPHQSHFNASPSELYPIPNGIPDEDAVFLPNMETAVNLILDGNPRIGEIVILFGQGIVGLLTTSLLGQFPLADLITLDRHENRREASCLLGAKESRDPTSVEITRRSGGRQTPHGIPEADLVYELSGDPAVLDAAIGAAGYGGRVVIGSWYGQKRASLDLGGRFHRERIQITSSQVSTLAPELSGRWTKLRRIELAWEMIRRIKPSRLITHQYSPDQAKEAYRLIDQHPEQTIQVVFKY